VIFTNFAQFLAIIVFVPIISIVGLKQLGVMHFIQNAPVIKYSISYLWQDMGLLFLSFSFMGIYPGFIQRSFMTENYKLTQRAIFKKSIIYLLFLVCIGINGLLSYMHYSGNDNSLALLSLIDSLIPPGLRGLAIVGLLAAVMSTADSELNIASISLTNDVFQPLFHLHDSKMVLLFTQTSAIIIGSIAIYLALQFDNTVALLFFIAGFWLPCMLVPFLACLYDITINKWAMIFCSFAGVATFAFWQINYAQHTLLKGAFVGMVVNFICFMLFRLLQSKFNTKVSLRAP
jgi:Na+/proline symporter